MHTLSDIYIKETLADSPLIFERGKQTWKNGSYFLSGKDMDKRTFIYQFDGSFGNYTTRLRIGETEIEAQCSCPYPSSGCRHAVAAALHARSLLVAPRVQEELFAGAPDPFLSPGEIRTQALEDRAERAGSDKLSPVRGDMFTGDHKVISKEGWTYTVCFHDPAKGIGHCSCPDYLTNGLGTCKHLLFMAEYLKQEPGFAAQAAGEVLPFADIFWEGKAQVPRLFAPRLAADMPDLAPLLNKYFDDAGTYTAKDISQIPALMLRLHGDRRVRIRENLLARVDHRQQALQLEKLEGRPLPMIPLTRPLYPFQEEGIRFGVLKSGVLIGDEMGLGKTVQAIGLALMKREIFGFKSVLVITLASLRPQWHREITEVCRESACIIKGTPSQRGALYRGRETFKITHYEHVIRDVSAISACNPDIIILDEAQRIRNISTRTAEAVKRLPKKHAIVLTGVPLENKPEDLYSIVQFLDPYLLTPLWRFAAEHFNIPRGQKVLDRQTRVAGYKNLDRLREKLSNILIRRTWDEVEAQLPDQVENHYFIDLAPEQLKHHKAAERSLGGLIRKQPLTPMDLRKVQTKLATMRMVCDSTFLVDRDTQVSPKLKELATIIDEVVIQNRHKTVIISEWTAMTFLVARHLSESEIPFAQVSGRMDQQSRRELAATFDRDPACLVFLATDAGSAGLTLSRARCLINVELPWPMARMEERLSRLRPPTDQDPTTCHVISLMACDSIEERIREGVAEDRFANIFDSDPEHMEALCRDHQHLSRDLIDFFGPGLPAPAPPLPGDIPDEPDFILFPEAMALGTPDHQPEPGTRSSGYLSLDKARMEAVLESGIQFMAGLVALSTGGSVPEILDREIKVDPDTGRISLSFRLPPGE